MTHQNSETETHLAQLHLMIKELSSSLVQKKTTAFEVSSAPFHQPYLSSANYLVEATLVLEKKFRKSPSVLISGKVFVDPADIHCDPSRSGGRGCFSKKTGSIWLDRSCLTLTTLQEYPKHQTAPTVL